MLVREISINSMDKLVSVMKKIGVDSIGIEVMKPKGMFHYLNIDNLTNTQCHILKQSALSHSAEAAVNRHVITGKVEYSDVLLFGNEKQLKEVAKSLLNQQFKMEDIGKAILSVFDRNDDHKWYFKDRYIDLSKKTAIIGILNVTPDSFSDGGKWNSIDLALKQCERMIEEGADIIDIGGESTRPGAEFVDIQTEIERVMPIIDAVKRNFDIPVSIDTYKSKVAEESVKFGTDIVNDIGGLKFDNDMAGIIAKNKMGCCIMHMKGTPRNMQDDPNYEDVVAEICDYFNESLIIAEDNGISRNNIVLDPGIGFGKRVIDNLNILNDLHDFKCFKLPILVGVSRKSFIGRILERDVNDRLYATIGSQIVSLINGADIIRTHDVRSAYDSIRIADAITKKYRMDFK
jgi:dihydropteroate synthase